MNSESSKVAVTSEIDVRSSLQLLKNKTKRRPLINNDLQSNNYDFNPNNYDVSNYDVIKEPTGKASNRNTIENTLVGDRTSIANNGMKNNERNNENTVENNEVTKFENNSHGMVLSNPEVISDYIDCPDCSRRFNPTSFIKHSKVCKKVFIQKRNVFDSTKMRIQDANITSTSSSLNDKNLGEKASKWKEQSENFREAMRHARLCNQAKSEGKELPPPVASKPDPSLIQCPNCMRRFNSNAAERHIPICKNIKAKPTFLKRGTSLKH